MTLGARAARRVLPPRARHVVRRAANPLAVAVARVVDGRQAAGRSSVVVARGPARTYAATVVEHLDGQAAIDEMVSTVVNRLTAASIDYFLVDVGHGHRGVVAVDAADQMRAVEALNVAEDERVLYLGRPNRRKLDAVAPVGGHAPAMWVLAKALRLFVPLATREGTLLTDDSHGCDIEFWVREPEGTLVAPRSNHAAAVLRATDQTPVTREWSGRAYCTYPALTASTPFRVDFPIDAVYTWVDGEDPQWLARKSAALGALATPLNKLAGNASRYAARDELRYSLRSLEAFAGWIRHIYLVTDDQVPPWLDTAHPKLTVVSHRDIFGDAGTLPTFNSHAIETQLHRIDGLAEHFIYLNDDVFFGRQVTPEHFFTGSGIPLFFPSRALIPPGPVHVDDVPVDAAGKNNRRVLEEQFNRTITNKFKHTPHALRRSTLAEVSELFAAAVERTAHAQFRQPDDVAIISLAHYVGWFTQRAQEGRVRYDYVNTSTPSFEARLERIAKTRSFDTFCLNDTDTDADHAARREQQLLAFLESYLPLASSFERSSPAL